MEKFDFSEFEKILKKRQEEAKNKNLQPTMHQQDAIDTAKMLGDFASMGIYMRIFKNYNYPYRANLLACRDWVLSRLNVRHKGRLFVSTYQKFLKLTSDKEVLK